MAAQYRALVMESVRGMVNGKLKLIFVEIMRELKASGYQVSAGLMNAMYFGVPQSCERMIFISVRGMTFAESRPSGPADSSHPGRRSAHRLLHARGAAGGAA